ILESVLKNKINKINEHYVLLDKIYSEEMDQAIQYLIKKNILLDKLYEKPDIKKVRERGFSSGASNIDWRIQYKNFNKKISKKLVLEAYFMLIKTHYLLKKKGFYYLIKTIKKSGQKNSDFKEIETKEFRQLSIALDRALFYFPLRTKCLEWASALTLMGLKRGWKCNLEIGVQNMPFAAHAWVKACDGVVADQSKLPEQLSVILSEPFLLIKN
ncbi:MAG: lasso peptide biosynthesis B2 protein, partial [Gammaproteobacteria bacterium]|nr:lasso peptide biosynthesis B2 protein [Gammaproteobacteria bacterium]